MQGDIHVPFLLNDGQLVLILLTSAFTVHTTLRQLLFILSLYLSSFGVDDHDADHHHQFVGVVITDTYLPNSPSSLLTQKSQQQKAHATTELCLLRNPWSQEHSFATCPSTRFRFAA